MLLDPCIDHDDRNGFRVLAPTAATDPCRAASHIIPIGLANSRSAAFFWSSVSTA